MSRVVVEEVMERLPRERVAMLMGWGERLATAPRGED